MRNKNNLLKLLCIAFLGSGMIATAGACNVFKPNDSTSTGQIDSNSSALEEVTVVLSQTAVTMTQYNTYVLMANMSDYSDAMFTWTSSDPTIVSVSENGTLTALKEGYVTITVSNGEKSAICEVTVNKSDYYPALTLSQSTAKIKEGMTVSIFADVTFMGQNVTDVPDITWTVDDPELAELTIQKEYVTIKGMSVGTTCIRATTTYRGMVLEKVLSLEVVTSDVFTLGVNQVNLYTYDFGDKKTTYALAGKLNEGTIPEEAKVTYTSANPEIATVSPEGVITQKGIGSTKITAVYTNGKVVLEDFCFVDVALTEVELNKTVDIFLDSADGDQTFTYTDLGIVADEYAWSETAGAEEKTLVPAIHDNSITFAFSNADCGEKTVHLILEGKVHYTFKLAVITKVIKTADEMSTFTTLGEVTDAATVQKTDAWHPDQKTWKQKGYFILGADIDLTGKTISNLHTVYNTYAEYGLIGGFDGRGHTITGGTYKQGGLFGNIPAGTVVKNVAIVDFKLEGVYSSAVAARVKGSVENVLLVCNTVGKETICGGIATYMGGTLKNCVVYWNSASNDNEGNQPSQKRIKGALAYCFDNGTAEDCIVLTDAPNPYGYSNGGTETNLVQLNLSAKWSELKDRFSNLDDNIWSFKGNKPSFQSLDTMIGNQLKAIPDLTIDPDCEYDFILPYETSFSITSDTPALLSAVRYENNKLFVSPEAGQAFCFTLHLTYNGTEISDEVVINVKEPMTVLNKSVDLFLNEADGDMTIEINQDLGLDMEVNGSTSYSAKFFGQDTEIACTATATGVTLSLTKDMYGEKSLVLKIGAKEYRFNVVIITKVIKTADEMSTFTTLGEVTDAATVQKTEAWHPDQKTWKQKGYFILGADIDLTGKTILECNNQ